MGVGRAVAADRRRLLTTLTNWLGTVFGTVPDDLGPFERALTHGSSATANYERLEFLGDRVLGLLVAEWLWESFPAEAEGQLSKRFNALVTGAVCAEVAREIGVRVALGADRRAVQVLVFKDAWRMVALGTGSGLLAALAAATFFRDRLFATSAFDVPTFVSVAAALAAAATVASYLPARRAAAVDPISVLRGD